MMKELAIQRKTVETKDLKTGRPFKFEKNFVLVNGIEIMVKPKGPTAYDAYKKEIESGQKFSLRHETLTAELQDGTTREYDSLYIQLGDEHLPMICSDSYGKALVIKALKDSSTK